MAGSPKKRARRLGLDPLDEPAFGQSVAKARKPLAWEPHNKATLSPENRDHVAHALVHGYPLAAIARALSVSVQTLKRLIADDPDLESQVEAQRSFEEGELRDILMELARTGDTVAAIFLAKARHGWRDRDDAKVKLETGSGGGVLVVPGVVPLDEWSLAAARQQAQYREIREPQAPVVEFRTCSPGIEGLKLERVLPGKLTH